MHPFTPTSKKFNLLVFSLINSVLIMAMKFIAWHYTGSNAIFSDALESIVNILAGGFALFSIYLVSKPKDADHPYGHGKIEFLSAGLEGGLIALAGLAIIGKAVYNLIEPQELEQIQLGIYLTIVAGIMNLALGQYLLKQGKKENSITIIANGKHILSDAISSVGLIAGLVLILLTEIVWIDNVLAILFGVWIARTGLNLLRKSVAGVMDEADNEIIGEIIEVLNKRRKDNWIDIHNFRVIKYGSDLHIDCHITFPWYYNLVECHREIEEVEKVILSEAKNKVEIFIHADPCVPQSCEICSLSECTVRKEFFKHRITWNLNNITRNCKHSVGDVVNPIGPG
jgi:cation diffusion facilitator family transporter